LETAPPSHRRHCIWLVEDSPLEAEVVKRALHGFDIEVFPDGPSMLERRSTHGGPSILILDGQLPGMSGLEICRFLRSSVDEATLPILMLTVQGNQADIVEALSAGANDYLTKPYDPAELLARVGGLSRARRLYEDLQTERQRLSALNADRERLLAHAQDGWTRAEQANRVKDDFLAVVSHELRTPLNAISGWVELLKSGTLTEEKSRHALQTIDRNARAQAQLIDDLLDVSRIISGKLHVQMEPLNFESVVRLARDAVEPTARAKNIQFGLSVEPGNYTVIGDAWRLQQVVWNLLSNAVKFTPSDGSIDMRLSSDGVVSLVVTDNGRGIDPDVLPHIFDRFRQAEGSMTRRYGGLGLGLAIVKHLLELHGGEVKAESAGAGRGATFRIYLKSASNATAESQRRTPTSLLGRGGRQELEGLRILLVDDDDDSREVAEQLLTSAGAKIEAVDTAEAALARLEGELPDLMVSDIGMPGEDGFSLIRKVRARLAAIGAQLPVVALTAYARGEDRATALRAGFSAHVSKPAPSSELVAVIASLCGRFSPPQ
jgi:signal transduction histidine kinase